MVPKTRRLEGGTKMNYVKAALDRKQTGSRIRTLIAESGYTYDEIATNLELSSSRVIYEWVLGAKLPSLENFINLVLMFDVKMKDIIVLR